MKLIACALPLLAGIPSVLSAQVSISLPRLSRPAVRATLGPIAVVATLGGKDVTVRATPRSPRRASPAGVPGTRAASASASKVPEDVASLRPGDLMLFASKGTRIDHVAIYAGDNRILHSSAGAGGVVYDDLSSSRGRWFAARHVQSRRVL